jgi:hypothetical protein
VQRVGGAVEEIAPGDVVWIEPGEKQWHGASPKTAMTHIAIAEMLDGTRVTRACICGSDLWPYNSMAPTETGNRMDHEFIGVVDAVGSAHQNVRRRPTFRSTRDDKAHPQSRSH